MTIFITLIGILCFANGVGMALYLCWAEYPRTEEIPAWRDVVRLLASVGWVVWAALLLYG